MRERVKNPQRRLSAFEFDMLKIYPVIRFKDMMLSHANP